MIETGDRAPAFELPGVVEGELRSVALSAYADDVVVVAFYPADFSPACTEELCSLRDFELFDLRQDVSLLAVSTDTAYSHREFADRHGLGFPLLSDNDGTVAEAYGVVASEGPLGHRRLAKRSVFVLDRERIVRYAWSTDDPEVLPELPTIRTAIEDATDGALGYDRYAVGYGRYEEGDLALDRGDAAGEEDDWLAAADAFEEATETLTAAVDAFDAARRYAEDDALAEAAARANELATLRRNAAKWDARAARRYAVGDDEGGDDYRRDANRSRERLDGRRPTAPETLVDDRSVDSRDDRG